MSRCLDDFQGLDIVDVSYVVLGKRHVVAQKPNHNVGQESSRVSGELSLKT
jgi:hypothetical protein